MTRNSQHGTQKPSAWYALGLKPQLTVRENNRMKMSNSQTSCYILVEKLIFIKILLPLLNNALGC